MSTLIDLSSRLKPLGRVGGGVCIARLTDEADLPVRERPTAALLVGSAHKELPSGFAAYLCRTDLVPSSEANTFLLPAALAYLRVGDIVRLDSDRNRLDTLYRRQSAFNTFLVTERCDNFCLMCSQPPKNADDGWLVDELLQVIPLIDPATEALGITGGEPGLLDGRLIELLTAMQTHLPGTAIHMLSNGRAFASPAFAQAIASVKLNDLMVGIPVYSDLPEDHDFVVQARGAFDETIQGILNLKRAGIRVELRFVIHRETVDRMQQFAEFVARNLLFVDHVALMGLELMGFAKTNVEELWVDPVDYADDLARAVETLDRARIRVSIYNLPLCVLPASMYPFARRSISDWKNWFPRECEACARRDECGGFFASSKLRRSRGLVPFATGGHDES